MDWLSPLVLVLLIRIANLKFWSTILKEMGNFKVLLKWLYIFLTGGFEPVVVPKYGRSCINVRGPVRSSDTSEPTHSESYK